MTEKTKARHAYAKIKHYQDTKTLTEYSYLIGRMLKTLKDVGFMFWRYDKEITECGLVMCCMCHETTFFLHCRENTREIYFDVFTYSKKLDVNVVVDTFTKNVNGILVQRGSIERDV